MSPIHRPCEHGNVTIPVSLLQHIESAFWVDTAPPPDVIAAIVARIDAEGARLNPWASPELEEAARKATDCQILNVDEIHAVQQLRGWHRQRYGNITVDAWWLTAVRNMLDSLTLSLGEECDEMLREAEYDPELHAQIKARMDRDQGCGDCQWCQALDLRDRCDAILDAAGFDGGTYYRAYCLGETQEQLAEHYGWRKAG